MQSPPDPAMPERLRVIDELGLPKTLPQSAQDFLTLRDPGGGARDVVLLGLGPAPELLPELAGLAGLTGLAGLAGRGHVRWLEAPELARQLGEAWAARIPEGFAPLAAEDLAEAARTARVVLYRPGPRLFPGFWGPLLARLRLALSPALPDRDAALVWLPGGEDALLRRELREGFEACGLRVRLLPGDDGLGAALPRLLAQEGPPALFFSVNFSGLDPLGEAAHLLAEAGTRVAVWCVDNPLHLLSGLKARFWTGLPLFVTDDWFLPALRGLGARDVRHLPLAARAADLAGPARTPSPEVAELAGRLAFAGRSGFPGKADFFAGCRTPAAAWTEAERLLAEGGRPDFGWWLTRLGIDRLWPGTDARRAGFCAEETGKAWRAACLTRAHQDLGGALTVYGPAEEADGGWRGLLPPGVDLRPPVDYYTALPDICAGAAACLGCTSPLLPRGLTQRHFDVWAWGGLLLSDATPGLELFPAELTRPVTFRRAEDIGPLFSRLTTGDAAPLKAAWRAELSARHTYNHRARAVLDALGL